MPVLPISAAFVCGMKLFCHDGKIYSNGFSASLWLNRYLQIFSELVVIMREVEASAEQVIGMELSQCANVTFLGTKYVSRQRAIVQKKKLYLEILNKIRLIDFVIIRQSYLQEVTIKACNNLGKPYVYEMVGDPFDALWNHRSILAKIVAPFEWYSTLRTLKDLSSVIYVTSEYLQRRYPTRGKSIGISNVIINIDNSIMDKRVKKIESSDFSKSLVIGTLASVDNQAKGHRFVFAAMQRLKYSAIHCTYKIAGSGSKKTLIMQAQKRGIEKCTEFVGTIPHHKVNDYLDSLDIYIQPSLQEGLPRSLIEAMGRGLPSIGFMTGGIPELLDKTMICKKKSCKGLEKCIKMLVKNKDLMIEHAKRNYLLSCEYEENRLNNSRKTFMISTILSQINDKSDKREIVF